MVFKPVNGLWSWKFYLTVGDAIAESIHLT